MEPEPSTSKAAMESATEKSPAKALPPTLDIAAEEFDPLEALYADPSIPLTKRKSKVVFQNMAALESAFSKKGLYGMCSDKKTNPAPQAADKTPVADSLGNTRRFLPHQMVIQTDGIKKRNKRTLLRQIENVQGPLEALRNCMQKKVKIKVYTRSQHGVRGTTTGYVITFDKHWNLLMSDVEEKWKRRKYKYDENKFCGSPTNASKRLKRLGIVLPEVSVKSLGRKTVEITRSLPQVLIRGEEVVLVITADGKNF